jgi:hypothetical protein
VFGSIEPSKDIKRTKRQPKLQQREGIMKKERKNEEKI